MDDTCAARRGPLTVDVDPDGQSLVLSCRIHADTRVVLLREDDLRERMVGFLALHRECAPRGA